LSEQAASTAGASEADSSAAGAATAGTAVDGGATTSQAGADTFATERDSFEAERRQLQSQRDRLRAEIKELEERRGQGASAARDGESTEKPLTASEVQRILLRTQELSEAKSTLKERYPLADEAILARAHEFESAEDFAVALERSHNSVSALVERGLEAKEKELRERYEKAYGPLKETPVDQGGGGVTGAVPTVQQLASMSFQEYSEAEEKFGKDVIDSILRQAS